MSVASQLESIAINKAAIKAAIAAKNPSVAPTDALEQWPLSIASIEDSSALKATAAAPSFSSSTAYSQGDLVTYEGKLYKATAARAAGDWNSGSGFVEWTALPPRVLYGTCTTSASTAQKAVTCVGYDHSRDRQPGTVLIVKFTNAQSYNGAPTLNINSTGAINIKRAGTTNAARYEWSAGEMLMFVWDGTYWVLTDGGWATTTYYGATKLSSGNSTSTSLAQTPGGTIVCAATFTQGEAFALYSASATYAVGAKVVYGSNAYICSTAITTKEEWNPDHWTKIDPLQTQINGKADWNILQIASPTVTGNSFALDPNTSVYRVEASISSGTATIPTPTATNIPNGSNYYCFEMEVSVGAGATTLVGPTGWTWLEDGGLPESDFADKTLYIAVRLDCNSGVRTFLANVWRVA